MGYIGLQKLYEKFIFLTKIFKRCFSENWFIILFLLINHQIESECQSQISIHSLGAYTIIIVYPEINAIHMQSSCCQITQTSVSMTVVKGNLLLCTETVGAYNAISQLAFWLVWKRKPCLLWFVIFKFPSFYHSFALI